MTLDSLCLVVTIITTITCEPPVNNYLPPGAGTDSGGRPASQYGTPQTNQAGFDGFYSERRQSRDSFDLSRSGSSGPLSAQYGPPGQGSQGLQDGFPGRQGGNSPPSSQYSSPNREDPFRGRGGSNNGLGSSQIPESSYGTPSQENSLGLNAFNEQGASYQGPGTRGLLGGSSSSSTYGTPDFGKDRNNINQNYRRSGVDDSNEPAKYEFNYEVDDVETGTMFGHSEQRNGALTTGQYNVVLPDGRKQVIQYEANKDGYKPEIRYEGTGRGLAASGFGRGSGGNGGQGYPGADGNNDAFADAQPKIAPQGGTYLQPGFSQDTSGGYPSRRSDNVQDSFDDQGFSSVGIGSSYPGGSEGPSFRGRSQGGDFPGGPTGPGYSSGPQEGRVWVSSRGWPEIKQWWQ